MWLPSNRTTTCRLSSMVLTAALLVIRCCDSTVGAFVAPSANQSRFLFRDEKGLYMGKGFNSNARKTQVDLAKKMQLAKQQRDSPELLDDEPSSTETPKDKEKLKLAQDRSTFARLLAENKNKPPPPVRNTETTFSRFMESTTKGAAPSSSSSPAKSTTTTTPKVRAKDLKKRQKKKDAEKQGTFYYFILFRRSKNLLDRMDR
jgi:hypothetical protein